MQRNEDKFWEGIVDDLAGLLGFSEPSLPDASEELASAPDAPYSQSEISDALSRIVSGNVREPGITQSLDWLEEPSTERRTILDLEAVLHRNKKDLHPTIKKRIDELRRKALEEKAQEDGPANHAE